MNELPQPIQHERGPEAYLHASPTHCKTEAIYIVGGRKKPDAHARDEWDAADRALILRLDTATGAVTTVVEYVTPPEARPANQYACLFKAGSVQGDEFYVCTQTEILIYRLPHFERLGYISLQCFNDLHHVRPTPNGTLLVANTGLDMVLELSREGDILREWDVLGEELWTRFSRNTDYRKVPTTKPHRSHPNYVFEYGERIWVTRCIQKDAICLTDPRLRIEIVGEKPHDGVIFHDTIYFTTVDGHIVLVDPERRQIKRDIDLNSITGRQLALGWCRGLDVRNEDCVLVGFSRLRPTKYQENVQWVKYFLGLSDKKQILPTRVAKYDIRTERLCWEANLQDHELDAVFSIHTVTSDAEQVAPE